MKEILEMIKPVVWFIVVIGICLCLSMLVLFGGNFSYKKYQLQDGRIVECRIKYLHYGRVNLNDCKDGKRYSGQKKVTRLS